MSARAAVGLGFVLLACSPAAGDGMVYKRGLDTSHYRAQAQKAQQAFIHYADGVQRTMIAIALDLERDEQGVWIVPILAPSGEVQIALRDELPRFRGADPRKAAAGDATGFFLAAQCFVLLPVACYSVLPVFTGSSSGVVVDHLEGWGLEVEAVKLDSLDALREHVFAKGKDVERGALATFEPYLDGRFVFIVTRLLSREEFEAQFPDYDEPWRSESRHPCLLVEARCPEPFYPMRATSGYKDDTLPLRIVVTGYVEPVCDAELAKRLSVEYFEQTTDASVAALLGSSKFGEGDRVPYTAILATLRGEEMSDDFRFRATEPAGMAYARAMRRLSHPAAIVALLLVFVGAASTLSGALAGRIVLRSARAGAWVGMFNIATILCVLLAAREALRRSSPGVQVRVWSAGVIEFALIFGLVFCALCFVAKWAVIWPLGVSAF